MGFGTTFDGSQTPSRFLLGAELPLAPQSLCSSLMAFPITPQMICAGDLVNLRDTCAGDSGGPLFLPAASPADSVLVGITSWGEGCAVPNKLGVYTRVSRFLASLRSLSSTSLYSFVR